MIQLKNLSKSFSTADGTVEALCDVSLTIEDGDIYGIIGMSGAGKSTLVRCINMLERPTGGEVLIGGRSIGTLSDAELRKVRRKVTMIFQSFNLLMQRTCLENICFPLELAGVKKQAARQRARELLNTVGLPDKENAYPAQLSGGQMQRALLCRAVISDPKLLILDEPANFVDNRFENELYRMLAELHGRMAIVMISHDLGTITSVVRNIVCVNRYVHRHDSNIITEEQLRNYDCPIQLISHGKVPHTVLASHPHDCCPHTRTEE